MFRRLSLLLACSLTLLACGDTVVEAQSSGSASGGVSTGAGASGGATAGMGTCATGSGLVSLGSMGDQATMAIAADADGIVWSDSDGTVWIAGPSGNEPKILAKDVGPDLTSVALDADHVYVVNSGTSVFRITRATGASSEYQKGAVAALAVDGDAVYVTSTQGVTRIDKATGASSLLAQIQGASSIALDADHVYVRALHSAGSSTASIVSVPKKGGAEPTTLVDGEPMQYNYFQQEIVVDDANVYWVNSSQGTVMKISKTGGKAGTLASGVADPISVAADDAFVYFTVRGKDNGPLEDRAVAKVPKAGGPVEFIAHGSNVSAYGIAVDATHVYWTEHVVGGLTFAACK